jgi:hypothetical protein
MNGESRAQERTADTSLCVLNLLAPRRTLLEADKAPCTVFPMGFRQW